ncbi:MAG: glycoside hydrolase family 97 protein [Bacteroidales bacterium]|nr:glycoside hydrolase family 97 protein [Bacteroidales bacterium]MDD4671159.1 glycoside hydrolase family 97 protein [Bacteroidales bacterium]
MNRLLTFILVSLLALTSAQAGAKHYLLSSPDGKTTISIVADKSVSYSVSHLGCEVLSPSAISMTLSDGRIYGLDSKVKSAKTSTYKGVISTPIYKTSSIEESYHQIDIYFNEGFGLIFRAYNEGVAYRFYSSSLKKGDKITAEQAEFNFGKDYTIMVPFSTSNPSPYQTSFENYYTTTSISNFPKDGMAFSPILISLDNGMKVVISESDIESYPGMFIVKSQDKSLSLKGDFAKVPSSVKVHPTRCQEKVETYSDIMAVIDRDYSKKDVRLFPWRLFAISEKDTELPTNNLVYLLGAPNRIGDVSWIKPGKVAWDWWNNWGVTGVDFKVGINTDTYKYYIDFASANGIEYVVLDEGWSKPSKGDIMSVIPEIDLKELTSYAKSKNVDLILWCVAYVLDNKLEEACRYYSEMGIKGFKVDFMNRDDHEVVKLNYRIAETAAKYKMLIDFHGMYKPAGMNRTYPNVINFEGVWGLEQMKWSTDDMMSYDVTFPYIRMVSGPVDYTQGAMRNAIKKDFAAIYNNPSSQGTRAHQIATYIVFDSPLVMLCDNPTAYMKEQESTDYIVSIPTVWDETRILQGEIGKYIVTARRSGDKWYIGGITEWTPRDISLNLDELGISGNHKVTLFKDGINAHRSATDYKIESFTADMSKPLTIRLAPGGGFALTIE